MKDASPSNASRHPRLVTPYLVLGGVLIVTLAAAALNTKAAPYVVLCGASFAFALFFVTRSQGRARRKEREALAALRASESRFRTLVEQSPLSTQVLTPDGRTVRVNRAWEELWGVKLEQLGDYNVLEDPQLEEKGIAPYIRRGFHGEATQVPAILYDPEETIPGKTRHKDPRRWVRAVIYPVKDEQGSLREVVLMHEDITDRKRLEDELRARAEELAEANRLKDEFLATLSHELRTPLTSILGWSHMLLARKLDAETEARALEAIQRNAAAQTALINDLLDVSRIITGKLHLSVEPLDLSPIVESAVDSLRPAAEARGVRVDVHLDTEVGRVSGDAERLRQVVWNLLSNAVKFTPRGGRVDVSLARREGHAELTVTDTGVGIAPEFLPQVFDRFRQADGRMTREHGGLGLGLSIARHLVELHGGNISAASPGEGLGATFRFSLPLLELRTDESRGDGQFADHSLQHASLSGLRVVVVDDDEDSRAFVSAVLAGAGAVVSTAGSAEEALGLVGRARPDVLVADIGMPGVDGYELMRRVRALAPADGGRTPAAALTAYARPEDRALALDAGYQLHLAKPVAPADLLEAVARLAGRR